MQICVEYLSVLLLVGGDIARRNRIVKSDRIDALKCVGRES
jgi:hypothetical protein